MTTVTDRPGSSTPRSVSSQFQHVPVKVGTSARDQQVFAGCSPSPSFKSNHSLAKRPNSSVRCHTGPTGIDLRSQDHGRGSLRTSEVHADVLGNFSCRVHLRQHTRRFAWFLILDTSQTLCDPKPSILSVFRARRPTGLLPALAVSSPLLSHAADRGDAFHGTFGRARFQAFSLLVFVSVDSFCLGYIKPETPENLKK
ncbi:hypothetical protein BD413DRAFT_65404 [Trametes elegans]|nr:hypothetical protein BD413DRAFT_65404 [Trametes elegans]